MPRITSYVRLGIFCVAAVALTACGYREQAIIGVEDPQVPVEQVERAKSHDIYVMTTRQSSSDDAIMFSGERGTGLQFARVTVTIPPGHKPGEVERPTNLPPDATRHMTIVDPVRFSNEREIVSDVNSALRANGDDDSTLIFVHGYNTTFTDAVLRLGQFVEDSGFDGVPILFTWASAGRLTDYVYDLNSALAARNSLVAASQIMLKTNTTDINLVAHSMGNFLTVEAMKQARLQNNFNTSGRLRNVILASADIDVDVFAEQMSLFDPDERRFYVLISEDDKALNVSRFLARGVDRVGDADVAQLEALGVTVIDLTDVKDIGSNNHSKFADSPEVVQVIGGQMLKGDSLHTAPKDPGFLANVYLDLSNAAQGALRPGQ